MPAFGEVAQHPSDSSACAARSPAADFAISVPIEAQSRLETRGAA